MPAVNSKVAKKRKERGRHQTLKYTEENMQTALKAIKAGDMTAYRASQVFGIPKQTLSDKLNGKVPETRQLGAPCVLDKDVEQVLEDWILEIAHRGFPVKKYELCDVVQAYISDHKIKTTFKNNRPGPHWFNSFLKRHPRVSLRKAESVNRARASVTEDNIRYWFSELKLFLERSDALSILEDPTQIFNTDETNFLLCPDSGKVLGPCNFRNFYQVCPGNEKEGLTVLGTFSAAGDICPLMIVYPYQRVPLSISQKFPDGWILGRSESGWMRTETFYEYVANAFHRWLEERNITRPILFLMDGHRSHINRYLTDFCEKNGIILYCLYPNATHILQPADVSVFKPLKQNWKNDAREYYKKYTKPVTKVTFSDVISVSFKKLTEVIIQNGFRRCGLYPYNPDAVDFTKCLKSRAPLTSEPPIEKSLDISDVKTTLSCLESLINSEVLDQFKSSSSVWEGDVEHKSLFSIWQQLQQKLQPISSGPTSENDIEPTSRPISPSILEDVPMQNENESPSVDIEFLISDDGEFPSINDIIIDNSLLVHSDSLNNVNWPWPEPTELTIAEYAAQHSNSNDSTTEAPSTVNIVAPAKLPLSEHSSENTENLPKPTTSGKTTPISVPSLGHLATAKLSPRPSTSSGQITPTPIKSPRPITSSGQINPTPEKSPRSSTSSGQITPTLVKSPRPSTSSGQITPTLVKSPRPSTSSDQITPSVKSPRPSTSSDQITPSVKSPRPSTSSDQITPTSAPSSSGRQSMSSIKNYIWFPGTPPKSKHPPPKKRLPFAVHGPEWEEHWNAQKSAKRPKKPPEKRKKKEVPKAKPKTKRKKVESSSSETDNTENEDDPESNFEEDWICKFCRSSFFSEKSTILK